MRLPRLPRLPRLLMPLGSHPLKIDYVHHRVSRNLTPAGGAVQRPGVAPAPADAWLVPFTNVAVSAIMLIPGVSLLKTK